MGLDEQLQEFVGKPFRGPRLSLDPVNEAMIRHLVETLEDANPIYTDDEAAKQAGHEGIVAPPAALQVWSMSGYHPALDSNDHQPNFIELMEGHGYTGVVATNCDQEYVRYLRPGDRITMVSEMESIVGPKQTALGEGYFLNTVETYTDQHGEVVGRMRFRMLRYKPKPKEQPTGERPRPSTNQDNAFFWEGVEQHELRIQRCADCKRLRHPAQPGCPHCQSLEWDFVAATGTGTVYSYVVHHHPPLPGFTTPYVVAVIELEEGVRMVGEVLTEPENAAIGLPVQVTFTKVDDELTVPQWEPRS